MADLEKQITLYGKLFKGKDNTYKAVLSDDSIDRENEIVGKEFLKSALDEKTVGLIDHKNSVMGMICEWTDKEIRTVKGHNALVATPKWFESNPNTTIIKGMLEEGANIGLSIGAIPKEHDVVKRNGKEIKRWTSGEIIEASFVAIPANKHAQISAVAKQLNLNKTKESGNPMEKEEKVAFEKKANEIIETMKGSKAKDIEKVLIVAEIPKDIFADMIKELEKGEKAAAKTLEKAEEIAEAHKEETHANLVKLLEDAEIPKDVIESLTKPNSGGGKQKPGAGGSKGKPDDDESSEQNGKPKPGAGKKSLTETEIDALVEKQVNERLDKVPFLKSQRDVVDMTTEQKKEKAADLIKANKLPILPGGM